MNFIVVINHLHDVVNVDGILVIFRLSLEVYIKLKPASIRQYKWSVLLVEGLFEDIDRLMRLEIIVFSMYATMSCVTDVTVMPPASPI